MLMTAPLFSNRGVPTITKIGFAALLSVVIVPLPGSATGSTAGYIPTDFLPFVLAVGQEILVGVLIGFVTNLIFVAVGIAANMMGVQAGFRAASLFNPFTNVSSSALDQFYTLTAIALFLVINGHHWLIVALARTFEVVPVGSFVFGNVTMERLIFMFNQTFVTGVTLALPVVGTLLITDVGLGLLARAVPQIQVFFVGLPLKMGLGFLTLALTVPITLPVIRDLFANLAANISAILVQ